MERKIVYKYFVTRTTRESQVDATGDTRVLFQLVFSVKRSKKENLYTFGGHAEKMWEVELHESERKKGEK